MQKKYIYKIILSIVLAITFVGCGNDSKNKTTTTETVHVSTRTNTGDVDTTTPIITPKSLVLTVSTTTLNKDDNTTVEVLATYEDKPPKGSIKDIYAFVNSRYAKELTVAQSGYFEKTYGTKENNIGTFAYFYLWMQSWFYYMASI